MVVKRTSGGQQHRNGEGDGYMTEEKNMKSEKGNGQSGWEVKERGSVRSKI